MNQEVKVIETPASVPQSKEVDDETLRRLRFDVVMPKPAKLHLPEEK